MIPSYSLIIPYYRTPEITRMALRSIFATARGNAEVVLVDNDPSDPGSRMLDEFPQLVRVNNATAELGTTANLLALDVGLRSATRDVVGLLHSDTVFLKEGWDEEWFGRLEGRNLAALGTFEREANPFRPWRKQVSDWTRHLTHRPRTDTADQKLMLHWLLTRRSDLAAAGFSFMGCGHLVPRQLAARRNGVEVLSLVQISRFVWHTSNITSLLTGQLDDPKLWKSYREKHARLLSHPMIQRCMGPVPVTPQPRVD
jgi:glycosyltransferase involved in cell wall biosynthesis